MNQVQDSSSSLPSNSGHQTHDSTDCGVVQCLGKRPLEGPSQSSSSLSPPETFSCDDQVFCSQQIVIVKEDTKEDEYDESYRDGDRTNDYYSGTASNKKRKVVVSEEEDSIATTSSSKKTLANVNHLKIRSLIDAGDKWEQDLEDVHGLNDAQALLCISIAAEHFHRESFPPSDGNLFLELAKEGWQHLKELERLTKLYQECTF